MRRPLALPAAALACAVAAIAAFLGAQAPANATVAPAPAAVAAASPAGGTIPTTVVLYEQPDRHKSPVIKTVKVSSKTEADKIIEDAKASGTAISAELDASVKPMTGATPNDPLLSDQWGLTRLDAADTWPLGTGAGQVVAVIDSGVDATHEDLDGATVLPGTDLITAGGDGRHDGYGHGTAVAAVIAAHLGNGLGGAGLAPDVKILPIRIFDDTGAGGTVSQISNAIIWAADHGATVINMSVATSSDTQTMRQAVSYALGKGVVLVASAGNYALAGNPVLYPAAIPGVIAVGATTSTDARASYSETGSYVTVVAPGDNILTANIGNSYKTWSGTSFSAPFVAAAAALVRESDPTLTPAQVTDRLTGSAQDLGAVGRDDQFGYGIIDPLYARTTGLPRPVAAPTPTPTPTPTTSDSPSPAASDSPSPTAEPSTSATPTASPTPDPSQTSPTAEPSNTTEPQPTTPAPTQTTDEPSPQPTTPAPTTDSPTVQPTTPAPTPTTGEPSSQPTGSATPSPSTSTVVTPTVTPTLVPSPTETATTPGVTVTGDRGQPLPATPTLPTGSAVTVHADGFTPGETVTATVFSTPQTLTPATADSAGRVSYAFAAPTNLEPGTHRLVLTGTSARQVLVFTVTGAPATPGAVSGGPLPRTGEAAGPLTLLAVALLVVGTAAVITGQRSRDRHTT